MNQGDRITKRLIIVLALAVAIVIAVAGAGLFWTSNASPSDDLRMEALDLNGVRASLPASEDVAAADAALADAQESLRHAAQERQDSALAAIIVLALVAIAGIVGLAAYLYVSVIRPFKRLESFADEVAAGNLEAPLRYERSNPFGPFAWAFDHLRTQLLRARQAEAQASESYKTALASLSHDLRTPLASLRAYAEALDMGLMETDAERTECEHAIMRKCDEASALVEDLFEHALADMERIKVECAPTPVAPLIRSCAEDFSETLFISCPHVDEATLAVDEQRLAQAVDNLLANALKHAPGAPVEVEGRAGEGVYRISVRDWGPGVPPEDLPFLQERFYRGSNAAYTPGAGLGLFIVNYLVERMDGDLRLENSHPGLCVIITLPLE